MAKRRKVSDYLDQKVPSAEWILLISERGAGGVNRLGGSIAANIDIEGGGCQKEHERRGSVASSQQACTSDAVAKRTDPRTTLCGETNRAVAKRTGRHCTVGAQYNKNYSDIRTAHTRETRYCLEWATTRGGAHREADGAYEQPVCGRGMDVGRRQLAFTGRAPRPAHAEPEGAELRRRRRESESDAPWDQCSLLTTASPEALLAPLNRARYNCPLSSRESYTVHVDPPSRRQNRAVIIGNCDIGHALRLDADPRSASVAADEKASWERRFDAERAPVRAGVGRVAAAPVGAPDAMLLMMSAVQLTLASSKPEHVLQTALSWYQESVAPIETVASSTPSYGGHRDTYPGNGPRPPRCIPQQNKKLVDHKKGGLSDAPITIEHKKKRSTLYWARSHCTGASFLFDYPYPYTEEERNGCGEECRLHTGHRITEHCDETEEKRLYKLGVSWRLGDTKAERGAEETNLFHNCSSWVGKRSYIRVSQDEVVFPLHDVGGFSHPGRLKMERAESVQVASRVLDTEDGMGMKTASRRSRGSRADRIATRHPRRGGAVSEARRPVGMGRGGRRCRRGRPRRWMKSLSRSSQLST
ncbi:hypothetical protein B0H10DRAFT_1956474 [Mycena sp. CBHHK59/15]|nr:hypothetical protein B0H10DRAFT_1956474 [Mycena sp. CBHHK59/15]